jgi:gas vesicle protein
MNIPLESKKHFLLPAFIGAAITYCALMLTADDSAQQQQIISLENRIQDLELLLTQKEEQLSNARLFTFGTAGQHIPIAANSSSNASNPANKNQPEQLDQELAMVNSAFDSNQILKDLSTQSDLDPRSFNEKVNDLLVVNPSNESIAIVSKGIFNMAENSETLPDYALESLYHDQTNPDIKRVAAQVLSLRGDNRLMEKQIATVQINLRSTNPAERQKALIELAKTRHASAANVIAPLLQDTNIGVKLDALLALRATGNQSHINVVEKLAKDPDPAVSWLANDVISNLQNLSDRARTQLASSDIAAELPLLATQ